MEDQEQRQKDSESSDRSPETTNPNEGQKKQTVRSGEDRRSIGAFGKADLLNSETLSRLSGCLLGQKIDKELPCHPQLLHSGKEESVGFSNYKETITNVLAANSLRQ